MTSVIGRGVIAGAVGTALLNLATYVDTLLTGRQESRAPGRTVSAVLDATVGRPPDDPARESAYGALAGMTTGLAVGVLASGARAAGVRLPAPLASLLVGAAAMSATDVPMTLTKVSDARDWSVEDWTRDAVPHLAFGAGVVWALRRTEPPVPARVAAPVTPSTPPRRHSLGHTLLRSAALGVAAGGRSSLGIAAPLVGHGGLATALATTLVGTEMVVDKLPAVPSRLDALPLLGRCGTGALGAAVLARRDAAGPWLPALVGAAGAVVGSLAGAGFREAAEQRGLSRVAAGAEDLAALSLTAWAVRA